MKKSFWIIQNGFFFFSLLFSDKTAFFQTSADFVNGFEKQISSESSSNKDANRCKKLFCSSSGSGDSICEKHIFQKQLDVFFCYSLYLKSRSRQIGGILGASLISNLKEAWCLVMFPPPLSLLLPSSPCARTQELQSI